MRNIGSKKPKCLTENGMECYEFQVGDKVTKPLLAVSKICQHKKAVFFGPAPDYKSYNVDDPEALVVSHGKKTEIELYNGTYVMKCHECYENPRENIIGAIGDSDDIDSDAPHGDPSSSSSDPSPP